MLLLRYVINTVVIYCDWKIHWFSGAHRCDLCQVLGVTMKGKVISFAYIFIAKAIKSLLPEKYMPCVIEVMGKKVEA